MIQRLLGLLTACMLTCAVAEAQLPLPLIDVNYDPTGKSKTSLTVTPLFDQLPPSGYYPIRVSVSNDSTFDRTWEFSFVSLDGDDESGNQMRSSFSVSCPNKDEVVIDLLVPLVTAFYEDMSASVTLEVAVRAPPPLRGSTNSITSDYSDNWPAILVSEYLDTRNGSSLASSLSRKLSSSSHLSLSHGAFAGTMGIEFGAGFNPKQMPDDWRAFSGYDFCLMTEADWSELAPGVRNAIVKWTRLGGNLVVYTQNATTDLATLKLASNGGGSRSQDLGWGTVRIANIPSTGLLPAEETIDEILETTRQTGGNQLYNLRAGFSPHWPLQAVFGSKTAHIVFFIIVLLAFAILVGPVNLFVFAKAGQRHRLFITTPIISLAASVVLVVLILFQDGFGGRGERLVLMEVGPENSVYLAQEQIARTGVLLGTGFVTSEPGFLSPIILGESRWARVTSGNFGGNSRYSLELQPEGLRATGDWFKSRSEHGHVFETIRPSRGRLDLVQGAPAPVVNSTFAFPLEALYYVDDAGELWKGQDVLQGRNTTLQSASRTEFDAWLAREQARFAPRNRKRVEMVAKRPGHFMAATTEAPAVETLRNIDWVPTRTLLSGPVTAQ